MTDSFLGKELSGLSRLFPGTALGSQQRNKLPDFSGFQTGPLPQAELLAPCLITRGKEMPRNAHQPGRRCKCREAELERKRVVWACTASRSETCGDFPSFPSPTFRKSEPKVTLASQSCVRPASWEGPGLVSPPFPAARLLTVSEPPFLHV